MKHFGRPAGYWKQLTDDKITSIITLEQEFQKDHWETWGKMLGGK